MWDHLINAFAARHQLSPAAREGLAELLHQAIKQSIVALTPDDTADGQKSQVGQSNILTITVAANADAQPETKARPDDAPSSLLTETLTPEAPAALPPAVVPAPGPEHAAAEGAPHPLKLPARYAYLGSIGEGGMGEVYRVTDRALNRKMALKVIHPSLLDNPVATARFIEEAQITAQLEHPGIVPVHEMGALSDGRLYFTMKEVHGRTFASVIEEVHKTTREALEKTGSPGWSTGPSGWSFRRLIDTFHRVCEAVAYAHARGVIHRDLKPSNIMVGEFGEVLVLDWGIAKIKRDGPGVPDAPVTTNHRQRSMFVTSLGTITGTPAYMPVEQAKGQILQVTYASDVYALGAILYEIISGAPPYEGSSTMDVWRRVVAGPPAPLKELAPVPDELKTICATAMARDKANRYQDAGMLATEVGAWLEGSKRREHALNVVAYAESLRPVVTDLLAEAATLERRAAESLKRLAPFAPIEEKKPGWELEDRATQLRQDAYLKELELTQNLGAALTHAPDLPEAHALLAEHYQRKHAEAEENGQRLLVVRNEVLLRSHDNGRYNTYLRGDGALSVWTDPPGAEVELYRYTEQDRRLEPVLVRSLGRTPLDAVELPMGSYLLKLRAEGRQEVKYPVFIRRLEHWDGVPPGGTEPCPIALPRTGELDASEIYVPGGWFLSGGDPLAQNNLPRKRLWLDSFVMGRFPVTVEEYLVFLNDLVANGREAEALEHLPPAPAWEESRGVDERSEQSFQRSASGSFELLVGHLRWPIAMVNWFAAAAYAEWLSARRDRPYRLPAEMEWEKAARGVDGRPFPWGHYLDPCFCHMRLSHANPGRALRAVVDAYEVDQSVYGVRGTAGNVYDWCQDAYQTDGPKVVNGRPVLSNGEDLDGPGANGTHRLFRGGSFQDPEALCRSAYRDAPPAIYRNTNVSFRMCRTYGARR